MLVNNEIAYEIEHAPAYASLRLHLKANQTVLVEAGGMAAMNSWIKMKSKVKGGLMKGLGRMLGGESLFLSEFTAAEKAGNLYISPGVPGDIQHYYLNGNGLMVQSSGFVASSPTVEIDTKFQGLKAFLVENHYFCSKQLVRAIFGLVLMAQSSKFRLLAIM